MHGNAPGVISYASHVFKTNLKCIKSMKIKIFSSRIWQTCYLLRRESTQNLPNKFENICIFKISNLLIEGNDHFKKLDV